MMYPDPPVSCYGQAFAAAVEAIYDAAAEPSQWPTALQAIADVFGDVGAVMVYARDDGNWGAICSPSVQAMATEHYQVFGGEDLRAMRGVERGVFLNHNAVTDRHVVSDDELTSHPYYQLMAKHGLRYFVGVPASPSPTIDVAISVQRSIAKPPYEDSDLALMTRLGRHAEKSLRLSVRLMDAEFADVGMRQALSRLGIGVMAIDSLRRVVFSNPAAERTWGDGLSVVNGRLAAGASRGGMQLDTALEQMIRTPGPASAADPKPILIERQKSERALISYVLPLTASVQKDAAFLAGGCAIILLIDPAGSDPIDPAVVRDVFGLTLGEARVAALVGSGMSPRDTANKLRITEETARTVLKRIFAKVGVSRQSQLSVLLTRLALKT